MSVSEWHIETNRSLGYWYCGLDTCLAALDTTRPPWMARYMAWMYILKCTDGSYHVGSTKDLEQGILQHQYGTDAQYTSKRLPIELVYSEEFEHVSEAYTREKQVQNWSRAKREALIEGKHDLFPVLAKKDFSK
jgi:predicted GIY-YIG superfamily endonuclease